MGKTYPAAINNAQRRLEALKLRQAGATYQAIADKLGYHDRGTAQRAVVAELKKINAELEDEATQLRALEAQRLDTLQTAMWTEMLAARSNGESAAPAVDRIIKIMERRAKLLGLDTSDQRIANAVENSGITIMQAAQFQDNLTAALQIIGLTDDQWERVPQAMLEILEQENINNG